MCSRFTKKMLVGLFAIGAGFALLGTAVGANPFVLDWRVLGFGVVSGTCETSFGSACTSISTGSAQGTHIGAGAYSMSLTTGNDSGGGIGTNNERLTRPAESVSPPMKPAAPPALSPRPMGVPSASTRSAGSARRVLLGPTITITERTASLEVRAGSRVPWGEEAWWPPSRRAGLPTTPTRRSTGRSTSSPIPEVRDLAATALAVAAQALEREPRGNACTGRSGCLAPPGKGAASFLAPLRG